MTALNRRTQASYAGGTVATFTYDAASRLTQADDTTDPHRPITRTYDLLNRLLTETTTLGTVSYAYDTAGRRASMTVSGQAPVTYTYDHNSRLRTITQAPLNPVDIQYDAMNRRTLLTLPNGVSTEYQYDVASRLTALIYRNALGLLGDLTYSYDGNSNRTGVGGSFARTLLPEAVTTSAYDSANRQLGFGASTMSFDDNGNLLTQTDPSGTITYTWDARNRLIGISGPTVNGSFAYDGLGRRAQKTLNSLLTQFRYDGLDVVREVGGAGDASYLRTLAIDEALVRLDSVNTVQFVADALGSTVALTNPAGGSATTYTYEPYGRTAVEGTAINPIQYTGRENDGTGLNYYRARYYQAALGRFVSEDPLGLAAGDANLYAYVRNQPATLTDPFGLWYTEAHGDQTVEVATACGLPPGDAEAAAGFNMAMDRNPTVLSSTSPQHAMPGSPWRAYTDRRLRRAMVLAAKGDRARAMRALGEGLHAIQDAWAHDLRTPQGTTTEHVFPKDRVHPDDPAQNPLWWKMSRQATAEYIKEYMRARGLKPTCD